MKNNVIRLIDVKQEECWGIKFYGSNKTKLLKARKFKNQEIIDKLKGTSPQGVLL